jgi:hypothetical protein
MADDFEALDAYSTAVIRVAESVLPSVASSVCGRGEETVPAAQVC